MISLLVCFILFSSFLKETNFPKVSNSIFLIREREALQQQQQQQQQHQHQHQQQQQLNIFEDDTSWTRQSRQELLQRQLFPLLKQQQQTEQQVQQTGKIVNYTFGSKKQARYMSRTIPEVVEVSN